ncbi:uncharacterized protein G2W53_014451 [Senna tora]|uniref:Uncharacterized protein n=1 Tax=Senna tora TaxID=362788 RepID=A0A834WTA5_9FABA|nr:uncharacterized protein G2W53_014451 [Senna tora]
MSSLRQQILEAQQEDEFLGSLENSKEFVKASDGHKEKKEGEIEKRGMQPDLRKRGGGRVPPFSWQFVLVWLLVL